MGGGARALSGGSGAVTFSSTLDGGQALTVNSTGATTFGGAIGGTTPLTSLTTNAGGTTVINGGAITTTGNQTFSDAVTIGATPTTLNAGTGTIAFAPKSVSHTMSWSST